MKLAIFCDFDGTVSQVDVTDAVLERFADPLWREIQDEWLAGKMTAREVLQKQMPLVTVGIDELNDFIDAVPIDPFFAEFAELCARNGYPLYILSDGFDYWIGRILERALGSRVGVADAVKFFANGLTLCGDKVHISFPHFPQGCPHGCGNCKPALFAQLKGNAEKTVVIGDGISDRLIVEEADLVLARDGLVDFCRERGIASYRFDDFSEVIRAVANVRNEDLEDRHE
ncbi:MAG: MtnX-like HAD-IB family phosphatase [Deltaproteobacteria bacterium]|nr:MtnX-like HAD-IB family phosphatase [Deltaproteobacteria bacterium]